MAEYVVISKGKYDCPQPENAIPLDSYLFVRDGGKKYLLLKFKNSRGGTLTGLDLKITALNSRGGTLSVKNLSFGKLSGKPRKDYVLEHKIEVEEECADFLCEVSVAHYGAYAYSVGKKGESIDFVKGTNGKFDAGKALDTLGWENAVVSERTVKHRVLIAVIAFLMITAVLVFTVLQLNSFTKNQKTFIYSGVEYAFENDDTGEGTNIFVTGSRGTKSHITIPEEIEGHAVTKISECAFAGNPRIRSLTVEGNAVIEKSAFDGCKNLERISIENVNTICAEAFANCGKLSSLSACNLESIGDGAFKNCKTLSSVKLENERKKLTLGKSVFENCGELKTAELLQPVEYPADLAVFRGCNNLATLGLNNFSGAKTIVSLFGGNTTSLKNVTINTLDAIGKNFLASSPVQSVKINTLGSSIIGERAFYDCYSLAELSLPVSPSSVGAYAFYNAGLRSFDWRAVDYVGEYAFAYSQLTSFAGTRVTELREYAFAASAVKEVSFPAGLYRISDFAFSGCLSLTSVTVPETVYEIGIGAFNSCGNLENIVLPYIGGSAYTNTYLGYIFGAEEYTRSERYIPYSLKRVTLTNGANVPDFAFYGGTGIREIKLPAKTGIIGEYAFANCSSLTEINLDTPLQRIGAYSFYKCASLVSLTLPDCLEEVGMYAFSGCNGLTQMTVPFIGGSANENNYISYVFDGVPASLSSVKITLAERIGESAFYGCSGLKQIILPENLKDIGEYAFFNCGLTQITIPATVETVKDYAFAFCRQLQQITIPESVKYIGERTTFAGCYTLWEIWNFCGLRVWAPNAIVYDSGDLQLQKFKFDGYEFGYSRFEDKYYLLGYPADIAALILPSQLTFNGQKVEEYAVPAYLFSGDTRIISVVLPACVNRLGEYAFSECVNLESVKFEGAKFTEIEQNTFERCTKLKSVNIPYGVKKISGQAFVDCILLEDIIFESGLEVISPSAFQNCNAVKTLQLPEGLKQIGAYAFTQCQSLQSVLLPSTLERIEEGAFDGCIKLLLVYNDSALDLTKASHGGVAAHALAIVSANESKDVAGYYETNGVNYLYCRGEWTAVWLAEGATEIVLDAFTFNGKSVASLKVRHYAFSNTGIVRAVIGGAVTEIGEGAFAYCYALERVEFSAKISEIPVAAFSDCQSLREIKFPDTVKKIGENAFRACYSLTKVELNSGLTRIGGYAFAYCGGLTEITVPSSVTAIADYAFYSCQKLYVVYNLSGLNITEHSLSNGSVGYYAAVIFTDINQKAEFTVVREFEFAKFYNNWYLFRYNGSGGAIELPKTSDIKEYTVKSYAFENTSLSSLLVPVCVSRIEDKAFRNEYFTVYFEGTRAGWKNLCPPTLTNTTCYEYVDCVHGNYEWTYLNGSVSTWRDHYGFEWETTKAPTCAEEGVSTGTCPHCNKFTVTSALPKTNDHDFEWVITKKPTCTEEGEETGTCKICGKTETRPIPVDCIEYPEADVYD